MYLGIARAIFCLVAWIMEHETLFTASKWDILKCLESGSKSPLDLAKESNTSIANISQQLRLLELAGFVKSERISNRDKGQPRILYSLAGTRSYIVLSSPGYVNKAFMKLSSHQKDILKIWFLKDEQIQYYLEKFYWTIEENINSTDFLSIDISDPKGFKVYVLTDSADIKKKLKDVSIVGVNGTKSFTIQFIKNAEPYSSEKYFVIHDQSIGPNEKKNEKNFDTDRREK